MTSGRQRRRVVPDFMAAARLTVPEHIHVERTTLVYVAPDAATNGLAPPGSHLVSLLGDGPLSVYECAAHLGLPYCVVRLLVAGLVGGGTLLTRDPPISDLPDIEILELVLSGLRAL
ncbi:DUF742 domain-containing protein [Nonomuraea sp. KC401]|uniref:DUF742 domain-containing protein n=1 Tax=unclassified Nonomuraea TaxID=2593643 RepID=UPI0010FF5B58|nr:MULTISPECIES: DUF742 domain-containing protein [unclassified Nonomuraea]NBE98629.1 DUF742 domain-containing protein [Nonomuraea sp. K271]TLF60455.1 DUF742 domain-containing protein [Nonomuraea sp. KC401]